MAKKTAFCLLVLLLLYERGLDVNACGDKFLFVGRVLKYQQAVTASNPGSIALYTNPASKLPAAVQELKLDTLLPLAGHHVEAIADAKALTRALGSGRYDLLLVDLADAEHIAEWRAAAPALVILPVLYHPTKTEQLAAEQTYKRILKTPAKPGETLALVNNVLKERRKAPATRTS
jgi:hypothetical protein